MTSQLLKVAVMSLSLALSTSLVRADDEGAPAESTTDKIAEKPTANPIDPWEGFNRSVFGFNDRIDRFFLKPVAKGYVFITPNFFRRGVSNVFSNLLEIPSALNGVLQGNVSSAAHDTGRLLVNSTIGLVGLIDVAQHMGLKQADHEDFGQTLAVWGLVDGPYVVLPFLGPSTLRDTTALPVDWYTDPKTYIDYVPTRNTTRAISLLDTRASLLELEKNISGDRYSFIRDVYLQRRNFQIKNGQVEDSFGVDEEDQDSGL